MQIIYNKVLIAPVTYWGGEEAKTPSSDQQMLVEYFQQTLKEQLGKKFAMKFWGETAANKLSAWTSGTEAPH